MYTTEKSPDRTGSLNEEGRKVVPWIEIRSKLKRRDSSHLGNLNHPRVGDTLLLPLAHGLRSQTDMLSQGGETADCVSGALQGGNTNPLDSDTSVLDRHSGKLYQWFNDFNHSLVDQFCTAPDNKPMVDTQPIKPLPIKDRVPLAGFASFTDWIKKLLAPHGRQSEAARALSTSSARVAKWQSGAIPDKGALRGLAQWAGVDFFQLQLLAHDIEIPSSYAPRDEERWTQSARGAMVGRRWEELHGLDPRLAAQFADMLDGQVNALLQATASEQAPATGRRRA